MTLHFSIAKNALVFAITISYPNIFYSLGPNYNEFAIYDTKYSL